MNGYEIDYALEHLTLLVDTREQDTEQFRKRLAETGLPYKRKKLDFGDYSVMCELSDGSIYDFRSAVCIERKMNLDELCNCFCKDRPRFIREFERAMNSDAKTYLLVENADFEKAYAHKYRSQMSPQALIGSMFAWLSRYDCQLIMCKSETSGKIIKEILYREVKEHLSREIKDG